MYENLIRYYSKKYSVIKKEQSDDYVSMIFEDDLKVIELTSYFANFSWGRPRLTSIKYKTKKYKLEMNKLSKNLEREKQEKTEMEIQKRTSKTLENL